MVVELIAENVAEFTENVLTYNNIKPSSRVCYNQSAFDILLHISPLKCSQLVRNESVLILLPVGDQQSASYNQLESFLCSEIVILSIIKVVYLNVSFYIQNRNYECLVDNFISVFLTINSFCESWDIVTYAHLFGW